MPTTLPPPADYLNRPPKELVGYQQNINTGGNGGTPASSTKPATGSLTFHSFSGIPLELRNAPSTRTNFFRNWLWYDATPYTHARIVVHIFKAGPAGMRAYLEYTGTPDTEASFTDAGLASAIMVPLDVVGSKAGGWLPLLTGARTDRAFRVIVDGGDGSTPCAVGDVEVEFDIRLETIRDRWWWRSLTPSVVPTPTPATLRQLTTFWGPTGRAYVDPWVSPLPAAVRTGVKSYSKIKGNTIIGTQFGTDPGPSDANNHSGPCGCIIGAPLEAQDIPAFDYETAWTGVGGNGVTACHGSLQLHLYRPSTGALVYSSPIVGNGELWFRFVPRAHRHRLPMGDMTALAGDRFLLWISTCMELTGGGAASIIGTQGIGTNIGYNGGSTIGPDFDDASSYWQYAASYTDFPLLKYTSQVA